MHRPLNELHLFDDFEKYSRSMIFLNDIDPVYPLLKQIIKKEGFDPEKAVFWYSYFYSIESMVKYLRNEIDFTEAKYGIERGRTPQVRVTENKNKTVNAWNSRNWDQIARECRNGREFAERVKEIPFFGHWVSYKITEIFAETLDYKNLKPNDMNLENADLSKTSGPTGGLRVLYGMDEVFDKSIVPEWEDLGRTLAARWNIDIGEVESLLCKFYKVVDGRYVIGKDVNEFIHLSHLWPEKEFIDLMESCKFHPRLLEKTYTAKESSIFKKTGVLMNSDLF